jgi:hypothetical protein
MGKNVIIDIHILTSICNVDMNGKRIVQILLTNVIENMVNILL